MSSVRVVIWLRTNPGLARSGSQCPGLESSSLSGLMHSVADHDDLEAWHLTGLSCRISANLANPETGSERLSPDLSRPFSSSRRVG